MRIGQDFEIIYDEETDSWRGGAYCSRCERLDLIDLPYHPKMDAERTLSVHEDVASAIFYGFYAVQSWPGDSSFYQYREQWLREGRDIEDFPNYTQHRFPILGYQEERNTVYIWDANSGSNVGGFWCVACMWEHIDSLGPLTTYSQQHKFHQI